MALHVVFLPVPSAQCSPAHRLTFGQDDLEPCALSREPNDAVWEAFCPWYWLRGDTLAEGA